MAVAVLVVVRVVEAAVYLVMAATALGVSSVEVADTVVLVIAAAPLVVLDLAGHLPEQEIAEVAVPVVVLRIPTEDAVAIQMVANRLQQVEATPKAIPESQLGTQ